jgi:hypothetical protein
MRFPGGPGTAFSVLPQGRLAGGGGHTPSRYASETNGHHRTAMYRNTLTIPFALLALTLLLPAAQAKMYRWVDKDGNVHYSDKIPPDQVDQARDELNRHGIEVGNTPRAKTAEEIKQERELERLRAEQQRLIEEQQAADRVLLRTFRSEDDIILARDGKLAAIDVMIQVTHGNIRRHQGKLTELQQQAANLERSGRQVPEQLRANMDTTVRNINESYSLIDTREQEKQVIRDKFGQDLKRFRELKNIRPKNHEAADEQTAGELKNLVKCADPQACDATWKRAEAFVKRHATTQMQLAGPKILMTRAPKRDSDISITVSRLQRDSETTLLFMDLYCRDTPRGNERCQSAEVEAIRQLFQREVGGN